MIFSVFNLCKTCRRLVAGTCLCAALFVSAAGAKPPPARAVGPMLSTAIGATSTFVGHVSLRVDDQVNGKVYTAVREEEQRRRIALYEHDPLMATDPDFVTGPTSSFFGFDATTTGPAPRRTGPTGPTSSAISDTGRMPGPTGPVG